MVAYRYSHPVPVKYFLLRTNRPSHSPVLAPRQDGDPKRVLRTVLRHDLEKGCESDTPVSLCAATTDGEIHRCTDASWKF